MELLGSLIKLIIAVGLLIACWIEKDTIVRIELILLMILLNQTND